MQIKELLEHTKKLNVLFVEDDIFAREEINGVLERFFAKVVVAEDGIDGIEKFKQNNIDLIITDINMPKMDGLSMFEEIKKIDENVFCFILTAHNETQYFIKSILLGVNGFILKPFVLEQFIANLERIYKDIETQKEMQELRCLLSQYQKIVDRSIIVCKFDTNKKITYSNKQFNEMFDVDNFENLFYNEKLEEIYQIIHNKGLWQGVVRVISKNGKLFYSKIIIKPLLNKDGEIIEFIVLFLDVDDILDQKQMLLDYVEYNKNVLVAVFYLADFKNLRYYFGEKVAREMIFALEKIFKGNLPRSIDKVFNLNDGKFVFATSLENKDKDIIIDELKKYQYSINHLKIDVGNFAYNISAILSVANGVDVLENACIGLDVLLDQNESFINANNLSNRIKQQAQNNLEIINLLKESIENNQIISFYQAIIDNKTQKVAKYESLVRIQADKLYFPNQFLPIAKHSFYYSKITQIVLKTALDVIKENNVSISVNISTADINKENITTEIYNILDEYKDYTSKLTFEILEDETIENKKVLDLFIDKIKSYNISIALDDFGSGYSNFARVLELKPDILKIDGSLVKNINNDKYSYNLVKAMVEFAKLNSIQTIAEFVENEEIFELIKELGVDYSQGYYFAKPERIF